ncbi:MAG: hypothetical protein N3G20_02270 [Verrucomicrobiae bacterium]|nr:hypothetical protein [Verrucomicrobiae bacterium]
MDWLEANFPDVNFVIDPQLSELDPTVHMQLRFAGLWNILEALEIATEVQIKPDIQTAT